MRAPPGRTPKPRGRVCHVSARRKNVRVKIYCIRRSTYGSTSGPSQSVKNTPLATQLHHANMARRIDVVSPVSTSHNVSCSRRFFYFPSFFSCNNTHGKLAPLFVCARAKVRRWREERLRSQTWDPPVSETTVMHVLTRHSLYSTQRKYCIKSSYGTKPTTVRFFRLSTYAL